MKNATRIKKNILFVVCVFAIAIFNQMHFPGLFWNREKGAFVSLCYLAIAFGWGMSALDRIREKRSRRVMTAIVFFLSLWLVMRGLKYDVVFLENWEVYFWYGFYLPQIVLPMLVFFMTLHINYSRKMSKALWFIVPAVLLVLGIWTNNLHFLAFDFGDNPIRDGGDYTYGPLFYLSYSWMWSFLLASVVNAARKSKLFHLRRAMIEICSWLLIAVGYSFYFAVGPFWTRSHIFNFPEAHCFLYIIFLEICIQNGLILSSSNHAAIFSHASLMAEITDETDGTYMKTDLCPELTMEQKQQATESGLILDETYECHSNTVRGGRVYWLNDISEMLALNNSLEDMGEAIAEENNILEAEIQAKEQKAALEEQNRIYNEVNEAIANKADRMFTLLEEPDSLKRALILAAYMKRKGNLVILSRQQELSDIKELGLCINESFSYLRLKGCVCNCTISGEGMIPAGRMADLYDVFEEVLEAYYEELEAFLCYVRTGEDGITVRCQMATTEEPEELSESVRQLASEKEVGLNTEVMDKTLYVTLSAKEVGR